MGVDRSQYAKEFVDKAREDLKAAEALFKEGYFSSSCFHSQQVAEKYLKTFLIKNNVRFKKIHDLEQLVNMCADIDKKFLNVASQARFLNPYYIESRYPDFFGVGEEVVEDDAIRALNSAKEITSFVEERL